MTIRAKCLNNKKKQKDRQSDKQFSKQKHGHENIIKAVLNIAQLKFFNNKLYLKIVK